MIGAVKELKMLERFKENEEEFLDYFRNNENCKDYLEQVRWGGNVACVECGSLNVGGTRNTRWRCRDCRRLFSLTSGTIFENSVIPLRKWFKGILYYVSETKGYPASELRKRVRVSKRSAWFMHKRIQELFKQDFDSLEPLDGVHEIDEKYVGALMHKMNKKRYAMMKAGRGVTNRLPILAIITRRQRMVMKVVEKGLSKKVVCDDFVRKLAQPGNKVFGDESPLYKDLRRDYDLHQFNHSKRKFGGSEYHSNTVEGSFKLLDEWLSRYSGIGLRYKQNYVDEFVWNYNANNFHGLKDSPIAKFELLFKNINRRVDWKGLISKGNHNEKVLGDSLRKSAVKKAVVRKKTWAYNVLKVVRKSGGPIRPNEIIQALKRKGLGKELGADALSKRVSNSLKRLVDKNVIRKSARSSYELALPNIQSSVSTGPASGR